MSPTGKVFTFSGFNVDTAVEFFRTLVVPNPTTTTSFNAFFSSSLNVILSPLGSFAATSIVA
ncbi:hypothetical protein D3C73_1443640 [compost metagenome]